MTTISPSPLSLVGHAVFDPDGAALGQVVGVYLDDRSAQPAWAALGGAVERIAFVPLHDAIIYDDAIEVAFTTEQVEEAPYRRTRMARELSEEAETELHRHYRVDPARRTKRSTSMEVVAEAGRGLGERTPVDVRPVAEDRRRLRDQPLVPAHGRPHGGGAIGYYIRGAGHRILETADTLYGVVVEDVRGFARRRPGLFVLASAIAGFVVGRAVRLARADHRVEADPERNSAAEDLEPAALEALSRRVWPAGATG